MGFWDKVKSTTNAAVAKTKDVAETMKLKSDIAFEKDKIEQNETAIGAKYFELYGSTPADEFVQFCAAIDACNAKIAELEAQIRVIKGFIICPKCGMEIQIDTQFCPGCGIKIEKPEPASEETEESAGEETTEETSEAPTEQNAEKQTENTSEAPKFE